MFMSVAKMADLAGPGIGNYADVEKVLPEGYTSLLSPGYPAGHLCGEGLHRGEPLPRAQPADGPGPAHRELGERGQRHARPGRVAYPRPVPHLQRPERPPGGCPGGPGRHEVEADG